MDGDEGSLRTVLSEGAIDYGQIAKQGGQRIDGGIAVQTIVIEACRLRIRINSLAERYEETGDG